MDMHPAQLPEARRPSTAHDRPVRTPFGPRRPKNTPEPDSPLVDRPDSPIVDPTAHFTLSSHADAAVQVPSTPPPSPPSLQSTPQKPAPATFISPPPLTPPPAVSFESTPIPWKGLPLEAAQWTFSSSELQEIVSKAIRLSARESFVRLLSLQALEVDIVREEERLEAARLAAQARWRFEVGRRTMLMHALNASAAFSTPSPGLGSEHAEGGDPIPGFVGQLASAIASCDSLLSTILQISDQQSQIALVQHQHWSSALGMALRKLNRAHERQGQELKRAQARVQTLEDELEEAWREAEKMAIEFDDLEQEIAESESSEIVEPEDAVDLRPYLKPKHDSETGTLGDMTIHTDIAVVLGVTATAVASKATLVPSTANLVPSSPVPSSPISSSPVPSSPVLSSPVPKPVDKSDTKSIRSVKSTRSRRSTRDGQSHLTRLSSARMRSRAASNASLRLPKALRATPSSHTSSADAPPMPALPLPAVPGDSFLDMDNVMQEHVRRVPPKRHPEPTLALPTPPHSAGLPPTHVPSIWLEPDDGKPTRLNALDRSHSLQIFSSLTPRKMRRSNLVMSLTGSDRSSDGERGGSGSPGSGSRSSVENQMGVVGGANGTGTGTGTASPTSNHSPLSLPTHALAHFRGPSLSSSSHSTGVEVGRGAARPGSAGARLTTTGEEKARTPSVGSPRKSLMSRASSVLLRRLSQATTGAGRVAGPGAGGGRVTAMASGGGGRRAMTVGGKGTLGSPSRSRLNGTGRTLVERWKDRSRDDGPENVTEEGEVMLIGSPHADAFDAP